MLKSKYSIVPSCHLKTHPLLEKTMKKSPEVRPEIARLPIAEKAKRVIETFLDAECGPGIAMTPRRADKRRRILMREIRMISNDVLANGNYEKAATRSLAAGFLVTADDHRLQGRELMADKLEELSWLLMAVATDLRPRS
jgi:hypothetical protein